MLADLAPGYAIYCTAKGDCIGQGPRSPWTQVGGTSAAAPLLAGGLALVDQALRKAHRQDVGLANPLLYAIDQSASAASVISDIVANNNDLGSSLIGRAFGCCTAGAGYDEASGLGSVNLASLAFVAGSVVPPIVNVGLSVPSQRRPVASKHLLAKVTCSGHCLMGAYARIKIGRSRKVITQVLQRLPAQQGRAQDDQDRVRQDDPGQAAQWPGPRPDDHRRRSSGRSWIRAATSRPARAERTCGSADSRTCGSHGDPVGPVRSERSAGHGSPIARRSAAGRAIHAFRAGRRTPLWARTFRAIISVTQT